MRNFATVLKIRILWASALCAISPSPAAAQTDLLSKDTITIEGDLRTIAVNGEPSWIDGGFGKLRFGSDGSETVKLRLAEADLAWKPRLGWNLTGLVSIVHQAGQDRDVDLNEAFFKFKPVPTGNTHYSARIGLMYPPISLEHGGPNWTVTNSITPSAINSWISEEVKIVAAEATIGHDFGGHDISITGAAFGFNDTSGTLLSYRGWALHDVKATAFSHLPLPPLDAEIALDQVRHSNTINEIDHRIGYYVRLDWHPPLPMSLYAFYYDNRGDGISARKMQESWNTKFLNIGATAQLAGDFKIMSQAMWGHTVVGAENPATIAVDVRYFSAYAMGVKEIGQGTISGRIEAFRTTDRGAIEPHEYSENGWAAMIAYKRPLTQNINLVVEALHVGSDRDGRVEYGGVAARQSQTQVQSSLRVKFRYGSEVVKRAAIVFSIAGLVAVCPAFAADVTVTVRTPDGHPLNNAVVMLETASPHGTTPVTNYEISQHDLMFDPFVIVVPAGSTVYFPNRDKVRHHVYSFSPAKRFDLKLFSNLQNRSVIFDRAGIVAIGCNIHDSMQAYIRVVNTPYFARTGADGRVVLRGVPNGASTLRVWHPYLRAAGNELTRSAPVTGNMTIPVVGAIRRPVPATEDY